jgi:serine protease Do
MTYFSNYSTHFFSAFAPLRLCVGILLSFAFATGARADDLARLEQQAFNDAAAAVADCVVQIRTVGGLDQLGGESLAQGPTTGLILTDDGYIVSSAINFAQQPASVLVRLPSGKQVPAEIVGRDSNRMLVLLKVEPDDPLPTPAAAQVADVQIGEWAVAVGRTYDAEQINVSVGIISAKNRMHGRAIQCDAAASAANYGGPLVNLRGQVIGVLAPMAPPSPGETEASELAGAEFYDSGIAFAVPLAHIRGILDRWIKEHDLKRGLLGVGMAEGSPFTTPAKITAVWPGSPAALARWQAGDVIAAVEGKPVTSQNELRFHTTPRYAGDELQVTIRRGEGDDAEVIDTTITLAAELAPFRHAFLGILPMRGQIKTDADEESEDKADNRAGLVIRATWPGSPADKLELESGDRLRKLGDKTIASVDDAFAALADRNAGDEVALTVARGDETLELAATLAELPTDILAEAYLPPAVIDPREDAATAEGDADDAPPLETLKLADLPQTARCYRPAGAGPPLGVLVWLGDGDKEHDERLAAAWRNACDRDRLALVLPAPADAKGWSSDDAEFLGRLLQSLPRRFDADPRRIVLAGEGKGGQLAYAIAFRARKFVRGIAVVDSPLPRTLELPQNSPTQRLAVLSVETENAPLTQLIRQDVKRIAEAGFPASTLTRREASTQSGELDAVTRAAIARWIDGLDRF